MVSVRNDKQKRNLLRSHHIVSLAGVFLLVFIVVSTFIALVQYSQGTMAQTATSFGFTVAGDYDQTTSTTNNLQKIKQLYNANQISFHLGLGDFSYNTNLTTAQADAWSQYAKGNLPANFPFEILAGRHDTAQMSTYKTDLPDHIGAISATCSACAYGQEYYFDYPLGAPLARFILISPNQTIPGYTYNYSQSGADYKWVSNTIDAARNAGIHWVIVGMHEYCFVIGTSSCSNHQLLDLLLNKHVDVILQAQKHNYQRSKQLALTPSSCTSQCCPILNATSYNANCVANAADKLTYGAGSVIVVSGTGGSTPQLAINTSDPKLGYFKQWMDPHNVTWGISQFTISATQLTEQFVPVSGGTFQDSFTITDPSPTPNPSASMTTTPSPSPISSGTPSAGSLLAQDTFQRPNQTYWGTASDNHTWGADANSLAKFSITNNAGQVVGSASSATSYSATLGPSTNNAEVEASGSISSFGSNSWGTALRWTNRNNFYKAYITSTNLVILKKVGGSATKLKSIAFTATAGMSYSLRFSVVGATISAKAWQTGTPEPANWMLTLKDSSLSYGFCGLMASLASGVTANVSSFQAVQQ